MDETGKKYPAYRVRDERVNSRKCLMSLNYEQILEIASVFYYVNKLADNRFFNRGLRLDEHARSLHKSIHDAAINCCLSLEEADRCEREGGKK